VGELDEVPDGATVIFSAHGVPASVAAEAARRGLDVLDATCPLVAKVHREVRAHVGRGRHVVLIGHAGHPEVVGTLGQVAPGAFTLIETPLDVEGLPDLTGELAYATQTTLSVADAASTIGALKARYPGVRAPSTDDICYATTNRQEAVKAIARRSDVVLVVGSPNSSNSCRLREAAEREGVSAQLIDGPEGIDWLPVESAQRIGVTAGASAPEASVLAVVDALRARLTIARVEEIAGPVEEAQFPLPPALRERKAGGS
jgi:4-hydroxy-3-methylbut-2-enyl diphosphate reductase